MRMKTVVLALAYLALAVAVPARAQQPEPAAPPAGHDHTHQAPDHLDHRFDDPEALAKSFDDPARDAWQMPARVIEALHITPGEAVADIGAGTGYFSVRLARLPAKPTVYAVDVEPSMITYVRQRADREKLPNVVPVQATADRSNLPEPVDIVLIVDTYHHIGNRVDYFRRLKADLKPGARVAIVDFRKDSPDGPPVEFRFTPEQIRREMADAGYSLKATYDFLPRQIFLIFAAQ